MIHKGTHFQRYKNKINVNLSYEIDAATLLSVKKRLMFKNQFQQRICRRYRKLAVLVYY